MLTNTLASYMEFIIEDYFVQHMNITTIYNQYN
jgi:hypothetical protein